MIFPKISPREDGKSECYDPLMEFQLGSGIVPVIPVGVSRIGDPLEDNECVLRDMTHNEYVLGYDPISIMSRLTAIETANLTISDSRGSNRI